MAASNEGDETIPELKDQLAPFQNRRSLPGDARAAADSVFLTLDQLEQVLSRKGGLERRPGSAGPPPVGRPIPIYVRLNSLYVTLNSYTEAPNQEEMERMGLLSEELDDLLARLKRLVEMDVPRLLQLLR